MGDNNVYSFLSNLFSKNNILFLPLPNFVDFKNRKDFEDVFKPQKFVKDNTYNPRFICMYMGEVSSRLNIKSDKYNDDSLSLSEEQPDDFINGDKLSSIPNFEVNFGDPKQTMFTNIELDQKEFTETDESFTIQNDLANNKSSVGLNLFDIYKVRSYSTTIDMLGCAQIQPFMYFDITNIPMFKGSYMIIKVDHSIKANTMDTKFKGVRIKKQKTKLVDLDTILYNYIEQFITERGNSLNSNLAPEDYLTFYNESKVNEYTESLKTSLKINKDNYLGNPIDYYDGLIITSLIGLRKTNVTGSSGTRVTPHKGIDLRGEQGVSNIKNVYDGYLSRVRLSLKFKSGELDKSGAAAAAGLYVETTHPYSNGQFKCRYMHMSKLDENIIPEDFKTTYRETFKDYLKIKDTYTYDSEDIDLNKIITSKKTFKFDYDNQRKIKTLKKGDVLGKVGGSSNHIFSGGSGGTHLHFDMRLENILTWSNTENKAKYVDPREFFKDVKLKDGLPLSDV
jgi:murein DD-endopeptidase MepM/ murein hydrolase activator NlpD